MPKFIDMRRAARIAVLQHLEGSVREAITMANAQLMLSNIQATEPFNGGVCTPLVSFKIKGQIVNIYVHTGVGKNASHLRGYPAGYFRYHSYNTGTKICHSGNNLLMELDRGIFGLLDLGVKKAGTGFNYDSGSGYHTFFPSPTRYEDFDLLAVGGGTAAGLYLAPKGLFEKIDISQQKKCYLHYNADTSSPVILKIKTDDC